MKLSKLIDEATHIDSMKHAMKASGFKVNTLRKKMEGRAKALEIIARSQKKAHIAVSNSNAARAFINRRFGK